MTTHVSGQCPYGCGETLMLVDGGHIMCTGQHCPNISAIDTLLHQEPEHFVIIGERGFTIEHPLRERIDRTMDTCGLLAAMHALDGPPCEPGRYRVVERIPQPHDPTSESFRSGTTFWGFERVDSAT